MEKYPNSKLNDYWGWLGLGGSGGGGGKWRQLYLNNNKKKVKKRDMNHYVILPSNESASKTHGALELSMVLYFLPLLKLFFSFFTLLFISKAICSNRRLIEL